MDLTPIRQCATGQFMTQEVHEWMGTASKIVWNKKNRLCGSRDVHAFTLNSMTTTAVQKSDNCRKRFQNRNF